MQQENSGTGGAKTFSITAKAVCWALCAGCMALIFWFSSRTAAESSAQSDMILEFFQKIFGNGFITDFIVRKGAHFTEYAGLGLLLALAFYIQFGKTKTPFAVLCASLYAVTDEIHQIFVDGRACKAADWAIDTAGALLGALFILAAVKIAAHAARRSKQIMFDR